MTIYSVTITIAAAVEPEWVEWMKGVHIPDVLGTGCFTACQMYRVIEASSDEPVYVMQYHCRSVEQYYRYRDTFAPALQKEHSERFSGRFRGSRQLLQAIAQTQYDGTESP